MCPPLQKKRSCATVTISKMMHKDTLTKHRHRDFSGNFMGLILTPKHVYHNILKFRTEKVASSQVSHEGNVLWCFFAALPPWPRVPITFILSIQYLLQKIWKSHCSVEHISHDAVLCRAQILLQLLHPDYFSSCPPAGGAREAEDTDSRPGGSRPSS